MPAAFVSTKKSHVYLLSDVNVAPIDKNAPDTNAPRQFNGVANSGKPFSYFGQRIIVDMAEMTYHDKVPALIEHDRSQRAGFGVLSVENEQLLIKGTLLQNEFGEEVAKDADAGFPWQMSAHVQASIEEVLSEGQTAIVNGQTINGPIVILRKCKIPEVSFTPTGVDDETSAVVLGDNGQNQGQNPATHTTQTQSQAPKDNLMTIEELQKALADEQAKTTALTKENELLKAENAKLAELETAANVDAQLSQAGFKKTDDGKAWQGVSDGTYTMLLSAGSDAARAMIGDLAKNQNHEHKNPLPGALLGEQFPAHGKQAPQNQDVQLSNNTLVANAQARNFTKKGFL